MKIFSYLLLLVAVAGMVSCGSQKKTVGYLENISDTTKTDTVLYPETPIQKNDVLSIFVYSESTLPEIDAIYNLPNLGGVATGGSAQGFLVDVDGFINYPRIGKIKAEGLTKVQLAETIRQHFLQEGVLVNPTVLVRLLNFKITMLGEIGSPGTISVPGERLNILEAIGLAGDLTLYGKKDDILVIREINGKREFGKIDITSRELFQSPYFQLAQNDIVIVNPNRNKARLNEQIFAQRISLGLSIISAIALLYNIFR